MDTAKNNIFIQCVCNQLNLRMFKDSTYLLLYICRVIQNNQVIILHLLKCLVAVLSHCFSHEFDRSIFKGSLLTQSHSISVLWDSVVHSSGSCYLEIPYVLIEGQTRWPKQGYLVCLAQLPPPQNHLQLHTPEACLSWLLYPMTLCVILKWCLLCFLSLQGVTDDRPDVS